MLKCKARSLPFIRSEHRSVQISSEVVGPRWCQRDMLQQTIARSVSVTAMGIWRRCLPLLPERRREHVWGALKELSTLPTAAVGAAIN